MKEKKETKEQSTELAKTEAKPGTAATPFGFMRRFATDMERLFEEFEGFRFPSLFGREFFPFTREFEHVGWVPEIEVLRKNGDFIVRADLPGLKRDDVKVELTEGLLTAGFWTMVCHVLQPRENFWAISGHALISQSSGVRPNGFASRQIF